MPFVEKLIPKGIMKDISPTALDAGGNRKVVNPLIDALNVRYLTSETGDLEVIQNIPGTVLKDFTLPAGTNRTIGTHNDVTNNKVIFFNWNSNGTHGIYTWDPTSGNFKTLIQGSLLNFQNSSRYRVTGVGVVNSLLYWTDGYNPQGMINMERDYSAIAAAAEFGMFKRGPSNVFTTDITNDTSLGTSSLAKNTYQFAKRYVYLDNEISALSSLSKNNFPGSTDTYTEFQINAVTILDTLENDIKAQIKTIQFLYQKNNDGNWYVFQESTPSQYSELFLPGVFIMFFRFYDNKNTEIIPTAEAAKIFDAISKSSKALATHQSRTFISSDVEGNAFDRQGNIGYGISNATSDNGYKEGGKYTFGIAYFDEKGRTPGVTALVDIPIPYQTGSSQGAQPATPLLTFAVHGKAPTWAKSWCLCRSKEQFYDQYMQIPVKVMFYVGEGSLKNQAGSPIAIPGTMEQYNNGKIYLKDVNTAAGGITTRCRYLHLNCPEQMPFVPTTEHQIRIITNVPGLPTSKGIGGILDFDGQSIVTDNFGIDSWDWYASLALYQTVWIEVFKAKKTADKPMFEVPDTRFAVNADGGHGLISDDYFFPGPVIGDTYKFKPNTTATYTDSFGIVYTYTIPSANRVVYKFRNMKIEGSASTTAYSVEDLIFGGWIESPSPVAIKSMEDSKVRVLSNTYTQVHSDGSQVPDYEKISPNIGRPLLAINNAVEINRSTTVRYSDPFIQDSNINGLSSYAAFNEYILSTSRTPITKLQPTNNILLAIHQRSISSMYVGYGVLTDAQGSDSVIKSTNVIGQDNEIGGGFGSYNPESVAEIEGVVFGFDIFRGAVWRYTQAGVIPPISDYGMKTYFKDKANEYRPYKDTAAIIGGIDPYNNEYIITFPDAVSLSGKVLSAQPTTAPGDFSATGYFAYNPDVAAANNNSLPAALEHWFIIGWSEGRKWLDDATLPKAVTWAFNYKANVWSHRYSFVPEAYCTIGNNLVSFVNGKLWLHNADFVNYNTFYGVKYPRQLRFAVNPAPAKNKDWMALQVPADNMAEADDPLAIVVYGNTVTGQTTRMRVADFEKLEGIYYGPILRDMNTPVPIGVMALREGNGMKGKYIDLLFENNSKAQSKCTHMNVVFAISEYSS